MGLVVGPAFVAWPAWGGHESGGSVAAGLLGRVPTHREVGAAGATLVRLEARGLAVRVGTATILGREVKLYRRLGG